MSEDENTKDIKGLDTLKPAEWNPRTIDKHDFEALVRSLKEFGDLSGIVKNISTGNLVGGHQRLEAFKKLPNPKIIITERPAPRPTAQGTVAYGYVELGNGERYGYREVLWQPEREKAANIAANRIQGQFDLELLAKLDYELSQLTNGSELLELTGQTKSEIDRLLDSVGALGEAEPKGNLADDFIVPPFSILDTKQGYWQDRKLEWLSLGIKSEVGRDDDLMISSTGFLAEEIEKRGGGTSVFDPVLCELIYRWFNVPGGLVLDPFAGGSVRGVVASKLGQPYTGIELRPEQVKANYEQSQTMALDPPPTWLEGDSAEALPKLVEQKNDDGKTTLYDLVFSCPPYADLEKYSEDPRDLSNMDYKDFTSAYWDIINNACTLLKPNRFACFVVGEVRGKKGPYYNFVGDTVNAFLDAGLSYYNEIILINPAGTLPLRAGRQFNAGRKVGKQHQNVLVFYKGDPKAIKANFKELDFSKLPEDVLTGAPDVTELK